LTADAKVLRDARGQCVTMGLMQTLQGFHDLLPRFATPEDDFREALPAKTLQIEIEVAHEV
jgi:hypothetical protein